MSNNDTVTAILLIFFNVTGTGQMQRLARVTVFQQKFSMHFAIINFYAKLKNYENSHVYRRILSAH